MQIELISNIIAEKSADFVPIITGQSKMNTVHRTGSNSIAEIIHFVLIAPKSVQQYTAANARYSIIWIKVTAVPDGGKDLYIEYPNQITAGSTDILK